MTEGKTAVIVGASGGIGKALAHVYKASGEYDSVIEFGRSMAGYAQLDLCNEDSIAAAAAYVRDQTAVLDTVIVASGLLHDGAKGPEKTLRELDPQWLMQSYQVNAIGPMLVAKHFLPLMPRDRITRFAALSARVGSISDNHLGGWYGYRASKAALHMAIRNLAIEWTRKNPQSVIVALHPGTVDTGLSKPFQRNVASKRLFTAQQSAGYLMTVLENLHPPDSGRIFAWDGQEITP